VPAGRRDRRSRTVTGLEACEIADLAGEPSLNRIENRCDRSFREAQAVSALALTA